MTVQALEILAQADIATESNQALVLAHKNIKSLGKAMLKLYHHQLLTHENFVDLLQVKRNLNAFAEAFILLNKHQILTASNRSKLVVQADPKPLSKLLVELHLADLLTTANFEAVLAFDHDKILKGFLCLKTASIATQKNLELLIPHPNPESFSQAMVALLRMSEVPPVLRDAMIAHEEPQVFLTVIEMLNSAKIFKPEMQDLLISYPKIRLLLANLLRLEKEELLTPETFAVMAKQPLSYHQPRISLELISARLFNAENLAMVEAHPCPRELCDAIILLQKAQVLTQEVFSQIVLHPNLTILLTVLRWVDFIKLCNLENLMQILAYPSLQDLHDFLYHLFWTDILGQEKFSFLLSYANPKKLLEVLSRLRATGLGKAEYLRILLEHPKIEDFGSSILTLNRHDLLTPHHFAFIVRDEAPLLCAHNLLALHQAGLWTLPNQEAMLAYPDVASLTGAIAVLANAGILTQENFNYLTNSIGPDSITKAINRLNVAKIASIANLSILLTETGKMPAYLLSVLDLFGQLTQENLDTFVKHAEVALLIQGLALLQKAKILTKERMLELPKQENFVRLIFCLKQLFSAGILTRENFSLLNHIAHRYLLTIEANTEIWRRIPAAYLTEENFLRLVEASKQVHPLFALRYQRDQILGGFASIQNTHSRSVHRSVSASAQKLKAGYGKDLNIADNLAALHAFIDTFEPSLKHLAAKRCIQRIKDKDFEYLDSSGILLSELLALAYLAIADDDKRLGTLMDAKLLLIEGLYEIQRGNNLNHALVDNGRNDESICPSGAFNKIMEKLNGMHADVNICFITHASASAKLPMLAKQAAVVYLRSISAPQTLDAYQTAKVIFDKLKEEDCLAYIWPDIREQVSMQIWDEFQEAYTDNPQDPKFKELMDAGIYVGLPEGFAAIVTELEHASTRIPRFVAMHSMWPVEDEDMDSSEQKRQKIR